MKLYFTHAPREALATDSSESWQLVAADTAEQAKHMHSSMSHVEVWELGMANMGLKPGVIFAYSDFVLQGLPHEFNRLLLEGLGASRKRWVIDPPTDKDGNPVNVLGIMSEQTEWG